MYSPDFTARLGCGGNKDSFSIGASAVSKESGGGDTEIQDMLAGTRCPAATRHTSSSVAISPLCRLLERRLAAPAEVSLG